MSSASCSQLRCEVTLLQKQMRDDKACLQGSARLCKALQGCKALQRTGSQSLPVRL